MIENKEACVREASSRKLTVSEDGRIQKRGLFKRKVAKIGSGPRDEGNITFLVYDRTGGEYVDSLLKILVKN